MALWRDPLDELIDNLDRTLPSPGPPASPFNSTTLRGCGILLDAVLRGKPDEIAKAEQDPCVKAYLAAMNAMVARHRANKLKLSDGQEPERG